MIGSTKGLGEWGLPVGGMFLCAGPCSAESEEQVRSTASALQGCRLSVFRAGVWKPRTHPGTFEGAGEEALGWLTRVREEFGYPIGVEVGRPAHVEAALRYKLDLVWIGARTTADPFAVQSIADALKGVDVPVLVKNPVSQDLEAWIGALERVHDAGVRRLGAIHRGFATTIDTRYRNAPLWRLPIELRRRVPELPLICDPSHMCGRVDLIAPTAQEALDLLYDGLMVEVHHQPAKAWSDAEQQLTPSQFRELMANLIIRKEATDSQSFETEMRRLRHSIDEIDDGIVGLLARRMEIVRLMGKLKREHQVSTLQPNRWQEILASRVNAAGNKGLGKEFISQIYQIIHEEAIRLQEESLFKTR
ncbi:MAG TPA: chorismate mutase [Tepidisphaeraceae bacterium]|nr:chorismate mutase [Tepidisphaeraceae bacterium]